MRTLDALSTREREIAELIAQGMSAKEVAVPLKVSPHTVRNHLKAIYRKLGIRSARGLAALLLGSDQIARLRAMAEVIDSPNTTDFLDAVKSEAAHQVKRWGEKHDLEKDPEEWFWLVGYLAGKALSAFMSGDREKALHHTISSAASLLNWHRHISAKMQSEEAAS